MVNIRHFGGADHYRGPVCLDADSYIPIISEDSQQRKAIAINSEVWDRNRRREDDVFSDGGKVYCEVCSRSHALVGWEAPPNWMCNATVSTCTPLDKDEHHFIFGRNYRR